MCRECFLARSIPNGACTHLLPQVEQNEPKIFSQHFLVHVESEAHALAELTNSHLDDDGISADKPHVAVQMKRREKHTHRGITKLAKMLSTIRISTEKGNRETQKRATSRDEP